MWHSLFWNAWIRLTENHFLRPYWVLMKKNPTQFIPSIAERECNRSTWNLAFVHRALWPENFSNLGYCNIQISRRDRTHCYSTVCSSVTDNIVSRAFAKTSREDHTWGNWERVIGLLPPCMTDYLVLQTDNRLLARPLSSPTVGAIYLMLKWWVNGVQATPSFHTKSIIMGFHNKVHHTKSIIYMFFTSSPL